MPGCGGTSRPTLGGALQRRTAGRASRRAGRWAQPLLCAARRGDAAAGDTDAAVAVHARSSRWRCCAKLGQLDPARRGRAAFADEPRLGVAACWSRRFTSCSGRLRELSRGSARHGSCGLGVGPGLSRQSESELAVAAQSKTCSTQSNFASAYASCSSSSSIRRSRSSMDLRGRQNDAESRLSLLEELQQRDWPGRLCHRLCTFFGLGNHRRRWLAAAQRALADDPSSRVIFEGAQGVLLDAVHGFFPFVTPSRTSFANARSALLNGRPAQRLGVLRAYATRHGPGPLVSEEHSLSVRLDEQHNVTNPWQGPMRVGWFDAVAARYALRIAGGIDRLALTCLDRLQGLGPLQLCHAYRYVDEAPTDLVEYLCGRQRWQPDRHEAGRTAKPPSPSASVRAALSMSAGPAPATCHSESVRGDDGTPTTQAEDYVTNLLCELRLQPEQLGCISMGTTATDKFWR
jgi:hypothetical protein